MGGTLYIVATPIGNLEDLTPRARHALASVDIVAAEDTRHSGRLLSSIGAKPALLALHDYNEERACKGVIEALRDGKDVALVSDAGTPLISDPGFRLVRAAHGEGIRVVPIPGPSALTAALSAAGLPTDRFCFEGFPPAKKSARRKRFAALAVEERTVVLYESVHRMEDCLADLADTFGADREAFMGRELTKIHEQCVQASLGDLLHRIRGGEIPLKGEFVLAIAGSAASKAPALDVDRMLALLSASLSAKEASRIAAELTGQKKNALYDRIVELKRRQDS